MSEPGAPHVAGEAGEVVQVRELIVGDAQPSEPAPLVGARPQRRVASPQAAHFVFPAPLLQRGPDGGRDVGGQLPGLTVDPRGDGHLSSPAYGLEQLVEGLGEELHAIVEELVGDLRQRAAVRAHQARSVSATLQACAMQPPGLNGGSASNTSATLPTP